MSENSAFDKLIRLLKELFQLDQPDLDFGLYRIMHARADEISQFLDQDLLPQVKDAFSQYKTADKAELEKELQQAIEQANGLGVDAETTAKVKELRQKIAKQGVDVTGLEQEVYDHLHKFFRRYYHEGDFLAKRVYKPGVYAIPYEGEEVKLHWANKDQYYIKTSEYLRDYAFTLKPGADDPMRVHFRLVDAAEGEHGNVKEAEGKNRVFILAGEDFIAEEDGESGKELVIRFEYRPATMEDWSEDAKANATAAAKKKPPTQKDLREDAVRRVLAVQDDSLKPWMAELAKNHIKADGEQADYNRLAAHLNRYTARNTFDYFIHKDLGGFLRRELDFYIKNEVMHLDDIESETAPRVEQYLSKIKVIRQIAGKIIDFLAQLENFQKKLWLKKKFVTETSYCIRIGCIPKEFYPEIAGNDAQCQEWVELHAIDELEADLTTVAYSEPLTVEFLKAHPTLMLDTRHFDEGFSQRLLEVMSDIDEQIDGVLFNSENFHVLSTLQRKYRGRIDTVYTDPPYNKGGQDDFAYKDNFQHSSWIAMIYDRLLLTNNIIKGSSCLFFSVDENEFNNLYFVGDNLIGYSDSKALPAITNLKGNQDTEGFASCHEYVVVFASNSLSDISRLRIDEEDLNDGWQEDEYGLFKQADGLRATGANAPREKRPNLWYPIFFLSDGSDFYTTEDDQPLDPSHIAVWPINDDGDELSWYWKKEKLNDEKHNLIIKRARSGDFTLYKKQRPGIGGIPTRKPKSFFYLPEYSSTHGGNLAKDLFGKRMSSFTPKSVRLIQDLVWLGSNSKESLVLDFFTGSGTTGHAVINLNREDGGHRKFILVEMGSHFDDTLLPRLKKAVYSPNWKDGKPNRHASGSEAEHSPRLMKVIRLESYEDALNNLEPRRTETQNDLLASQQAEGTGGLREQYLLRYWLDVETRGSQSLLNIAAFIDPTAYRLKVKRPGSEETREVNVDLLETFNWLIGLTVETIAAPQTVTAQFKHDEDPDLPEENPRRLLLDGRIREADDGPWWFRTVTGTTPDGRKTLVIWRKLTGEPERDNLVLDEWFKRQDYSSKDSEYDLIYVNGDNNLENLRHPDDTWKVRLIEEDFHRLMFEEAQA